MIYCVNAITTQQICSIMSKNYQCVTLRTLLIKNAAVSVAHTLTLPFVFGTFAEIIGLSLVYRQQLSADSLLGPATISVYFSMISCGVL